MAIEEEWSVNRDLEIRELGGKRRRQLQECYPEDVTELWPTKIFGESARTNQRGRADISMGAANKVILNGSCSISDGCIENRNRMIQRELTMYEVRRMMSVGKRLGFQFQENEGEVQSRLIELEEKEEERERQGKRD
ncbi:hypothetical protein SLA2020_149870 [Shorea laevis]